VRFLGVALAGDDATQSLSYPGGDHDDRSAVLDVILGVFIFRAARWAWITAVVLVGLSIAATWPQRFSPAAASASPAWFPPSRPSVCC
jgi:hypothetical protein